MKKLRSRLSLKRNIINILVVGWLVPVLVLTTLIASFVATRQERQIKESVAISLAKATDIFDLQLKAAETASKDASYYSNIRPSYLLYQDNHNARDLGNEVTAFLKSEYKYNDLVRMAVLLFPNDDLYFHTYNNSAGADYKNVNYFLKEVMSNVLSFNEDMGTATKLYKQEDHLYMIRNLVLSDFSVYGVLVLELNDEKLLESFESVVGYKGIDIAYERWKAESLSDEIKGSEIVRGVRFTKGREESFATAYRSRYGRNIVIKIALDNGELFTGIYGTWLVFAILVVLMIPLIIYIFRFFTRNVTEPVEVLLEGYDEIAGQNYGYQIESLAKNKEFYSMEMSFNSMSAQIKSQFDRILQEEIALRDAQIMALQSQINPHFLNNTFEIINWEARLNGNIKVSKMIEALSTMLEATMNRRGEQLHSLSEEISYVDAYAYIISERLGERFSYIKEIDETLLSVKVPKLIVQPIVENAVEHGLAKVQRGNVTLRVFSDREFVFLEIVNDGAMSEEDMERVKRLLGEEIDPDKERSLSLGIRNVNGRIKLIYGSECGLHFENRGETTVSTICIKPLAPVEQH